MSKSEKISVFQRAAEDLHPPFNVYVGRDTSVFAITEFDESRTSQEFAEESDVNNIMARYLKTGTVPVYMDKSPFYSDLSEYPSFHDMQNVIAGANSAFANLPSKVRERFDNDPAKFVDFIGEASHDELREMGLLSPEAVQRLDAAKAAEAAAKAAEEAEAARKAAQPPSKPAAPASTQ